MKIKLPPKLQEKIGPLKEEYWNSMPNQHRKLIRLFMMACTSFFFIAIVVGAVNGIMEKNRIDQEQEAIVQKMAEEGVEKAEEALEEDLIIEENFQEVGAFEIEQPDLNAHKKLIDLYAQANQFHKSLEHIERISDYYVDSSWFQTKAGRAFYNSGDPEKAIAYFERAKELNPDDKSIAIDLALANFRSGQPLKSIGVLQELINKNGADAKTLTYLGMMKAEVDPKNKESDKLFQKAIKMDRDYSPAYYQYGRKQMNEGNYYDAKNNIKRAIKIDPINPRYHARLGMVHYYLHKDKKAEMDYKTALSLNPKDYNSWYNLGELYFAWSDNSDNVKSVLKNRREAMRAYLKTVEFKPKHGKAHYKIGVLLNGNRQPKEALDHFNLSLNNGLEHVGIFLQIAIAYEALGDKTLALEYIKKAYAKDPFNRVVSSKLKMLSVGT